MIRRSHLQSISITGARLEDAQPLQLPAQQSQHGAVDVVEADARRAQGQAGVLDLQDSFIQLRLDRTKSAGRHQRAAECYCVFLVAYISHIRSHRI